MRKPSYVEFLVSKTRQRLVLLFLLLIPIAAFSQKGTFNIGAQIGYGSNMKRKNSDWKYDYYEAMAFTDLGTCKIKPRFGLGVRHYNSRTNLYKERTVVFASIGFGINW